MSTEAPQKIYLSDKDTAFFKCPKCHASKETDVSKYKRINTAVILKVKCPCGNLYSAILERRKFYRKEVKFPGKFSFCALSGQDQKGTITVLDISKGGLKFRMTLPPLFEKGDIIEVEFNLDNINKSLIKKQAFVRNIKANYVNAEFCSVDANDSGDKDLAFYLF